MRDQLPPLTAADFDAIARRSRPEDLWGLPAIAVALGVSRNTIRRWLDVGEAVPISRCGGRWFARRSELEAWRAVR